EERFLTTDDEASPENSNDERIKIDALNQARDMKDANEQVVEDKAMDEQVGNVQAKDSVPDPHVEKPVVPHPNSSLTLSSAEYVVTMIQETIHSPKQQPPQPQPKRSKTKIFLKKSKKPKEKVDVDAVLQRLIKLEKKVVRMSKIDHTDIIETSMQANMMNETIPITLYQTPSTSKNSFLEYDLKSKLHDMMLKSRLFLDHQKHLELYNALIESIGIDEAMAKSELDPVKTLKRHHDQDQDPPTDKDLKKRKRKDADTSSSRKEDKELLQDDVENDDGMVQHDDLAIDDMPHNDTSPKQ
ncbi:hypothetical protein Tco_1411871, partial [Tanacetum coccineum]